jgi:hypothetical protein
MDLAEPVAAVEAAHIILVTLAEPVAVDCILVLILLAVEAVARAQIVVAVALTGGMPLALLHIMAAPAMVVTEEVPAEMAVAIQALVFLVLAELALAAVAEVIVESVAEQASEALAEERGIQALRA